MRILFKRKRNFLISVFFLTIIFGYFTINRPVSAQDQQISENLGSPIHPVFPLLDENEENVLESNQPISTMVTCGSCHDTSFIEQHSYHSDLGLNDFSLPGTSPSGRPWDTSPGLFGRWTPLMYRYLSPRDDDLLDLGTAEWIMTLGARHVGGGPAVYSRDGNYLTELEYSPDDPQTNIMDPDTGQTNPWDWQESGIIEMNCFLCHTSNPDNESRLNFLHEGNFKWANSATLNGSGILEVIGNKIEWNIDAFDETGDLKDEFINIQDPTNQNCGLCHGLVHDNVEDPLVMTGCSPERWKTITTGQIISPQRLSDTGMNLADKEKLFRSWDIHAERLLKCTDCHYSLNNPLYYQETNTSRPEHLLFDPRRVEIGEYLLLPLHQFARGSSTQSTLAPELNNTMRRCDSCHETINTHDWLPYTERHMQAISCETCHIPKLFSSANQTHDWTVLHLDSTARLECRGVEGDQATIRGLLVGYEPVLLPTKDYEGDYSLSPHNMITTFFWVYDDPPRPVRLFDLEAAYFENGNYHPGVLLRFDQDEDGLLSDTELIINSPEKETFISNRLSLLGLENPRIVGEIQAYSINHNVTNGEWATKDCQACHNSDSRLTKDLKLASFVPGGNNPIFVNTPNAKINGNVSITEDGQLFYTPDLGSEGLYILGKDNIKWIDIFGLVLFLGTVAGISAHGGLRIIASKKQTRNTHQLESVYMYSFYERLWHWLQTFGIVILIVTGLIIHKPNFFGFLSFRGVVYVHNIIAAILGVNAALSLFHHLTSGEIKQYIPRPRGFFDQTISQASYYLRGIFRGEPHPFEKSPDKKLNPLQQLTYLAILNVLLPLQGITGILIWGAQKWPELSNYVGGLSILSPFHTLIAWLFVAFIVLHVYLTTTGYTPLTSIKAMINGWDVLERDIPNQEVLEK